MNINDSFESKYIRASDIPDDGLVATIDDVKIESVGQGAQRETKPILYFRGDVKPLVCNKTNAGTIAKVLGSPETDNWLGRKITLVAREVEFQGEMTMAVRVSLKNPNPPAQPRKPATNPPADDSPFNEEEPY